MASPVSFVHQASTKVAFASTDVIYRCPFDALEARMANVITVPSAPSDAAVHDVRKVFVHLASPIGTIVECREIVVVQSICGSLCTFVARPGCA